MSAFIVFMRLDVIFDAFLGGLMSAFAIFYAARYHIFYVFSMRGLMSAFKFFLWLLKK